MRIFCKVLFLVFWFLELAQIVAKVGGGEIRLNLLAKLSGEKHRTRPAPAKNNNNLNEHRRSAASHSHARIQRTGVGADLAASQDSNHRNYQKENKTKTNRWWRCGTQHDSRNLNIKFIQMDMVCFSFLFSISFSFFSEREGVETLLPLPLCCVCVHAADTYAATAKLFHHFEPHIMSRIVVGVECACSLCRVRNTRRKWKR